MIAKPHTKRTIGQYKEFEGFVSSEVVLTIDTIMRELRAASRKPNKPKETEEVLAAIKKGNQGKKMKKRVDLFVKMKDDTECYFELKSAKPNINEFTGIKKQMLDWIAVRGSQKTDAKVKTIVAIPYNPYEPQPYERWTLQGLFDLNEEVLVGKEFWDLLGGKDTYEDLLKVFEQAGLELYDKINQKIKSLNSS